MTYRTLHTQLDINDYGADPTGATSSITALTNALADGARQKKRVYVSPGTYNLATSSTITFDPILTGIDGVGPTSILDFSSSTVAGFVLNVAGSSGSHEAKFPLRNLKIKGSISSATTVDGIKLGGTGLWAPHCSFYNVYIVGFRNQVVESTNSWLQKWFHCNFEAGQLSAYSYDQAASNLGENTSFYGGAIFGCPQESLVLGPIIGAGVFFFGTSFDYSGRFIKQENGHVVCTGCHFEGNDNLVATGANEMFLLTRNSSTERQLLALVDCTFLPLWTGRKATITCSGSSGETALFVTRPYISTNSTTLSLRTFVQDLSGGAAAQISIEAVRYSESLGQPLYLDTTGSVSATPGRYPILQGGAPVSGTPFAPQGISVKGSVTGVALSTPVAPTVAQVGVPGTTSYWYKWVASIAGGTAGQSFDTTASPATQTTTGNVTLDSANYNVITGTPVVGATSYKLLKSTDGVTYNLLASSLTSPTYNDQGAGTSVYAVTGAPNPTGALTTGGIRLLPLGRVGNFRQGLGSMALYSDDGFRLFLSANQGGINIQPQGDGVATGQVTIAGTGTNFAAGIKVPITAKTATYTITDDDPFTTGDATGGAFQITLPTAVGRTGKYFTIRRINPGVNAVTVGTTSSQTIDGATTQILASQWDTLTVISDGANWGSVVGRWVGGSPSFFVESYGATATSTSAQNTVAFQAAMDACEAAGGGSVYYTRRYKLAKNSESNSFTYPYALKLPTSVHLRGPGIGGNVFSEVDAGFITKGPILVLDNGQNCDLIQSRWFNPLKVGTTLNGAQATNTGTIAVADATSFPATGSLTIGALTLPYTGKTGTTFTGVTGGTAAVVPGGTVVTLKSTYVVPDRFGVHDCVLDGNKANNSSGVPLRLYGTSYQLDGFVIQNSAGTDSLYTDGPGGGYDMEAFIGTFGITDGAGNGWNHQGPHDSIIGNGKCARNTGIGVILGTTTGTTPIVGVHSWGNGILNWDLGGSDVKCLNCISDGVGSIAGIRLRNKNVAWLGGSIYDSSAQGGVLVQIGVGDGGTYVVNGCVFDTSWSNALGAVPIRYMTDGGLTAQHNVFRGPMWSGANTRFVVGRGKTTVNGAQAGNVGTLNVADTSTFLSAGQLYVASLGSGGTGISVINYTGKTGTSFTGCTNGNAAMTIPNGAVIFQVDTGIVNPNRETWDLDSADEGNVGIHQIAYAGSGTTTYDGRMISFSATPIFNQGLRFNVASKTTTYTITANDYIISADATGGSFTVTLPTAVSKSGQAFVIKRVNINANTVTVNTTSSQTIDGSTTYVISIPNETLTVISDGANWLII